MRRAQGLLASERRHTLRAPHLFVNQPAPPRPCFSASFSLRHRATLLCDDHSPQDAVHVALTILQRMNIKPKSMVGVLVMLAAPFLVGCPKKPLSYKLQRSGTTPILIPPNVHSTDEKSPQFIANL